MSQKYGCLSGYWRRSLYLYAWPGRGRRAGPAAKREVGRWLWQLKTRNAIRELQISTARLLSLKYLVGSVECAALTEDGLDRPSAWGNVKWEARRQSDSLMISNIPALPSPRSTGPAWPYTVALSIYLQSDTAFWLHFMFKNNMTWLPEEIALASSGRGAACRANK